MSHKNNTNKYTINSSTHSFHFRLQIVSDSYCNIVLMQIQWLELYFSIMDLKYNIVIALFFQVH